MSRRTSANPKDAGKKEMYERFKGIDDGVGGGENGRGANKDGLDWEGPKKNANSKMMKFTIFVIMN